MGRTLRKGGAPSAKRKGQEGGKLRGKGLASTTRVLLDKTLSELRGMKEIVALREELRVAGGGCARGDGGRGMRPRGVVDPSVGAGTTGRGGRGGRVMGRR